MINENSSKCAVVILNWNGRAYLEKFLPSVIQFSQGAEVIVADNNSTDDSLAFLTTHFPSVTIIRNSENGGYAKGYNDALQKVCTDFYVLLNSDVEVTANWLAPVLSIMQADPDVAACQPKILDYNNRGSFEYAGAAGGFIDKFGYPFCRGRIFDLYEQDNGQYSDSREIFWATGACLFIRASAFHSQKGFDEDFFAHMEEIDLCWRLKNEGHKIFYCGESTVYHVGGGTLNKLSPKKTYLNFRNNLILLCKNHSSRFFRIKLFLRMILDGIAGVKFLLSGDASHCKAVIHAHFSFYKSFRKTLSKRKILKARIKKYATSCIYTKSIVADYYLRGKKKFSSLNKEDFSE